jgi:hypothetical protein
MAVNTSSPEDVLLPESSEIGPGVALRAGGDRGRCAREPSSERQSRYSGGRHPLGRRTDDAQGLADVASTFAHVGMEVSLATNGTMINDDVVAFLESLPKVSVSVSLDGDAENHDRLRDLVGAHRRTTDGIEALIRGGIEVDVNATIFVENLVDVPYLTKLARDLDIDVRLSLLHPNGRGQGMEDGALRPDDILRLREYCHIMRAHGIRIFLNLPPLLQYLDEVIPRVERHAAGRSTSAECSPMVTSPSAASPLTNPNSSPGTFSTVRSVRSGPMPRCSLGPVRLTFTISGAFAVDAPFVNSAAARADSRRFENRATSSRHTSCVSASTTKDSSQTSCSTQSRSARRWLPLVPPSGGGRCLRPFSSARLGGHTPQPENQGPGQRPLLHCCRGRFGADRRVSGPARWRSANGPRPSDPAEQLGPRSAPQEAAYRSLGTEPPGTRYRPSRSGWPAPAAALAELSAVAL